ncbi:MAG: DUF4435 domain-containing protein [Gammaproteobacteria bacterium]|nr:DUF4435 domain-containing protein [Gammaproteobacteria bacterium]
MEKFCGALCIVDSDFDRLDGNRLEQNNVIATDAHDLESLICRSSSLRSVLAEFGNTEKIKRFQNKEGRDIRTALLERALVFGRLRWAIRADPEMNSRKIQVPRFVDETSWSINQGGLFRFVAGSSSREKMLKSWMDQLASEDVWHIVRGPDLIEILRIGLKRVLGSLPNTTGRDQILSVLRTGMPLDELKSTELGIGISDWESMNSPYKIYGD